MLMQPMCIWKGSIWFLQHENATILLQISHCFALNGDAQKPTVSSVQGILDAYQEVHFLVSMLPLLCHHTLLIVFFKCTCSFVASYLCLCGLLRIFSSQVSFRISFLEGVIPPFCRWNLEHEYFLSSFRLVQSLLIDGWSLFPLTTYAVIVLGRWIAPLLSSTTHSTRNHLWNLVLFASNRCL